MKWQNMKGSNNGLIEVLSWYLHEGTEENHEKTLAMTVG
jgi:hypothetical protein